MNKNVLHSISYGMYVVSTNYDGKDAGCIINTLTQITSKNPIVTISVNKDNYTNQIIKKSGKLSVSILSEDTTRESISKFGYTSSKDNDKFNGTDTILNGNVKVFNDNIVGYIVCDVMNVIDAETHDIFVCRVIENVVVSDKIPMTYKYYREVLKGTSPKNAPTFEEVVPTSESKKYRCPFCGFIYDDSKEKVKFEDLPDDWKCPLCGANKSDFEEVK